MKNLVKIASFWFLSVLAINAFAAQWGALLDYNMDSQGNTVKSRVGAKYLLSPVLEGKPVRVRMEAGRLSEQKRSEYEKIIAQSYASWFAYPAELIRKSGRGEEFSDVLPILDKGIDVQFVSEKDMADIFIVILPFKEVESICGKPAIGCYSRVGDVAQIFIPFNKFVMRTMTAGKRSAQFIALHEIGHSLGFSDQYKQGRSQTSHMIYSSLNTSKSIMNAAGRLTCDDADGMINLIDITRGTSRGGEYGWRSLCAKSDVYYINGAPVGKSPYNIFAVDDGYTWRFQRYKENQLISEQTVKLNLEGKVSPFEMIEGKTVLEKDAAGRPVHMRGPKGEDIYYSYNYDKCLRMIFMEDALIRVEIKGLIYSGKNKKNEKEVLVYFFSEDGKLSELEYNRPAHKKGKEGRAVYQKDIQKQGPAEMLALEFDAKGRIIRRHIYSKGKLKTQKIQKNASFTLGDQLIDQRVWQLKDWYLHML